MGKVAWTVEASRWLRKIHDYIADDDLGAALRTVRGILAKADVLRRFPELGQRYERAGDRNVRVLRYGHYRIAYLVREDNDIDGRGR